MFNHNRGLWGYTGEAADGEPLTIQSTGMGGPSAAIVIAELAELGATTLMRVGTCGGLHAALSLGELLVVTEALSQRRHQPRAGRGEPGRAGPASCWIACSPRRAPAAARGPVVSTDLFYDGAEGAEQAWLAAGALAVEMETATLFTLAARRGCGPARADRLRHPAPGAPPDRGRRPA